MLSIDWINLQKRQKRSKETSSLKRCDLDSSAGTGQGRGQGPHLGVRRKAAHRRDLDPCVRVQDQATEEQMIFNMKIGGDISGGQAGGWRGGEGLKQGLSGWGSQSGGRRRSEAAGTGRPAGLRSVGTGCK